MAPKYLLPNVECGDSRLESGVLYIAQLLGGNFWISYENRVLKRCGKTESDGRFRRETHPR